MSYFKRQHRKPKVLACLLTGLERTNWVNPDLVLNLMTMWKDTRFEVHFFPVRDARPWEAARNMTILGARQCGADWMVSFDNDNFVHGNPLDIIASAGEDKHVIGLTYGVGGGRLEDGRAQYALFPNEAHGASDGTFREEESVAGGVLMVNRRVWEAIPRGPWFRWQHANNETLDPRERGACGEDVFFSRLVRQHGFKVWSHTEQLAGHYRTTDITGMVCTMAQLGGR